MADHHAAVVRPGVAGAWIGEVEIRIRRSLDGCGSRRRHAGFVLLCLCAHDAADALADAGIVGPSRRAGVADAGLVGRCRRIVIQYENRRVRFHSPDRRFAASHCANPCTQSPLPTTSRAASQGALRQPGAQVHGVSASSQRIGDEPRLWMSGSGATVDAVGSIAC